ncbi:MAG TPA: carboxymuconolactone decarboxylase family protein, partial [Burkholderiales bacterium]|nr:carboxymuconolactone decarboxylase family protein [Burkholderiales bacterium]
LNRKHEFRVHVRGAINNGATTDEIRETLLQAIVYCGAPAGLEAFREAQAVLDELAAERDGAPA